MNETKITIESTPTSSKDFFERMRLKDRYYEEHYILGFFRDAYHFVFWGFPRRVGDLKRNIKHSFQRMFKGHDETAIWGLDSYLTDIALPVLKIYRSNGHGYPILDGFDNETSEEQRQEWNRRLDVMINSFQLMKDEDSDYDTHDHAYYAAHNKEIQDGLNLFAQHYRNLWD